MRLTKKQLGFMDVFVSCMDQKSQLGNRLNIKVEVLDKEKKEAEATFTQFSSNIKLFKKMKVETDKEFEILISTPIFNSFLKTISNEDEEIVLSENGVKIGENSSYKFESYNIQFPDVKRYYNYFKEDPDEILNLKDINGIQIARSYIGKDDVGVVGFMDNSFVGSDKIETSIIKTTNETQKTGESNIFYIPREASLLFEKLGEVEIREYKSHSFWMFNYEDIYCVVEYKKYTLPYIFSDRIKKKYDHQTKIIFDKDTFTSVLKRMNIFAQDNPSYRVYLSLKKDNFTIQSRDFNESSERIEYESCDSEIFDKEIIVSCSGLLRAASNFVGDKVYIYISGDKDNQSTIRVEDENKNVKVIIVQQKVG